jgi:hypothetical protein
VTSVPWLRREPVWDVSVEIGAVGARVEVDRALEVMWILGAFVPPPVATVKDEVSDAPLSAQGQTRSRYSGR